MFVDCHNNARGPCEKNFTLPADTQTFADKWGVPYTTLWK
jgi:hypothetical protein